MNYFFKRLSDGRYFTLTSNEPLEGYVEVTEAEVIAAANEAAAANPVVPPLITMRQFQLGLLSIGQLGELDRAIKREDSYEGKIRQIEWKFKELIERDSEFVADVTTLISMGDSEIDQVFINGGAL